MSVRGADAPLVHVAGNAVVDVLLRADECPPAPPEDRWADNTEILSAPVGFALGGCGAASAYALGFLGARVSLNTNIGADDAGQMLRGWLAEAGVHVAATAGHSAVHIIRLSVQGRQSSYHTGERVDWFVSRSLVPAPAWALLSGFGAVTADDLEEMAEVCDFLKRQGTRIAFDPSPWFRGRTTVSQMQRAFAGCDLLLGTEEEIGEWIPGDSLEALTQGALDCGPQGVVVKRGPQGAFYADPEATGEAPAVSIQGGNSVGAGDTFNARIVYGRATGEPLGESTAAAVALSTELVRRGMGVRGAFAESEQPEETR
ncbi:MAG: carbohydrate kinase family protein [Candidatus Latescibacterota bacterium]|nr:carbohydrate kinase family protein [Candidatus Latescibacterota bacterium]